MQFYQRGVVLSNKQTTKQNKIESRYIMKDVVMLDKQSTIVKDVIFKELQPSKEKKIQRKIFLSTLRMLSLGFSLNDEQTASIESYFVSKEYVPSSSKSNKSHSPEMRWVGENLPSFIETMPKELRSKLVMRKDKTGYGYIKYFWKDEEGDLRELSLNWKNETSRLKKEERDALESRTKVTEGKKVTTITRK